MLFTFGLHSKNKWLIKNDSLRLLMAKNMVAEKFKNRNQLKFDPFSFF